MRHVNIIGLDLGQASDPSALIFLECPIWVHADIAAALNIRNHGHLAPSDLTPHQLSRLPHETPPEPLPLLLRGLKRYELGTPYPAIVEDVTRLCERQPHRKQTALVIDKTGVGAPVFDLFVAAGLAPIGITITGGDTVIAVEGGFRVPKRDLVGVVQSLLQTRRLKFAEALPLLGVLKQELQNFRVKIDPKTAHDSYSAWREGLHDDMVLGCALACWWAERGIDTRTYMTTYAQPARIGRG